MLCDGCGDAADKGPLFKQNRIIEYDGEPEMLQLAAGRRGGLSAPKISGGKVQTSSELTSDLTVVPGH